MPATTAPPRSHRLPRVPALDGWRAASITFVLAGHLLPLGLPAWHLNEGVAAAGMAMFFGLSGFLIAGFLDVRPDVRIFLLRRLFRIVPLAWLAVTILVVVSGPDAVTATVNYLFVANLPPAHLLMGGGHLWSLGVEMQFYVLAALLVWLLGRRGLWVLPGLCLAVTGLRILSDASLSIATWGRLDEILIGSTVYLLWRSDRVRPVLVPTGVLAVAVPALVVSGIGELPVLPFLRPYVAGLCLFAVLSLRVGPAHWLLTHPLARYLAHVSFAVYVVHGMLVATWLGSGDTVVKYLKRPLLLAATFALAHLSTFFFEDRWIRLGRRLETPRSRTARHRSVTGGGRPADGVGPVSSAGQTTRSRAL